MNPKRRIDQPPFFHVDARPSRDRPIDLVHLSHQTLGDRGLEREVLELLRRHLEQFGARIGLATGAERRTMAHALKGAARSVGAFAVGDSAEAIETDPCDDGALAALRVEMLRADAFIGSLLR